MPRRTKLFLGISLLAAFVLAALLLPIPTPAEMRAWADEAGGAGAAAFLVAYVVCTVAPIPRTVFNLAAGLLLGHVAGVLVATTATVLSGLCGFLLARLLGREFVTRHLHRTPVHAVNARLSGGGMLAVASLRLIPVVPFAPLSYCCGVSSIALRPYLVGTALGSVPGTIAVVVLGDALTGGTPPALLVCYAVFAALGAAGLLRVIRTAAPARGPMADTASRTDEAAD
ncbi:MULTISPECIES: TVP38/TMEM64 family protein [Prauserella salsuginis group]|uniref:TVP38/TMEM64 family membrane protein n=2 Tax=Prauserella salsuginis group TaxID=2893672 RepID=A0A839XV35_9PSEU|nr:MULTISPECIES: TVP38/TMEM64 family protein [Prauserella salsuginis group]MBB3664918.1 putative membrane protein YdjX (TVP38/TMEM64 family) [Prauserella sediminis]MCR3718388.1 putative membrane protein YdjX, TVP38/TMEM64 family, SNARE-associated domain [Prauserella flava]MCR3732958.1 putative membrane protein YdjX, TVP38/TMEM64 family, SNARE-associated domain [Prauserella salsuginis]